MPPRQPYPCPCPICLPQGKEVVLPTIKKHVKERMGIEIPRNMTTLNWLEQHRRERGLREALPAYQPAAGPSVPANPPEPLLRLDSRGQSPGSDSGERSAELPPSSDSQADGTVSDQDWSRFWSMVSHRTK
jgi:hypothetical protein